MIYENVATREERKNNSLINFDGFLNTFLGANWWVFAKHCSSKKILAARQFLFWLVRFLNHDLSEIIFKIQIILDLRALAHFKY